MRHLLIITAKVLAAAVFALVLICVGAFYTLRGGIGSTRILAFTQSYLKDHLHTDLTYSDGQIDFMKGLHFRNLKIVKDDESMKAAVEIPELDLNYDISILHKRLEILQFVMKDAKISVVQTVKEVGAKEPAEPKEQSSESMRSKLERFILNPPAEVVIDQVTIERMDLHFEQVKADQNQNPSQKPSQNPSQSRKLVDIHQFNFHFKMEMVQERLAASGDLSMAPQNGFQIIAPGAGAIAGADSGGRSSAGSASSSLATEQSSSFYAGGQWSVDVHREGKGWLYRFETGNLKFGLNDFYMGDLRSLKEVSAKSGAKGSVSSSATQAREPRNFTKFDHAEFTFDSNSLLHSAELFEIDRSSIETMKVTLNGKTTEVTKKDAGGVTLLGPQSISFNTLLANDLDFDFAMDSSKIQKAPTIPRAVSIAVKAHGSVPRTLDHLLVNSQIDLAGQPLLKSKFDLDRKSKDISFKGSGNLTLAKAQAMAIAATQKFTAGLALTFEVDGTRSAEGIVDTSLKTDIPNLVMANLPKPSKVNVDAHLKWDNEAKAADFNGKVGFENSVQGGWIISPNLHAVVGDAIQVKGSAEVAQTKKPSAQGPPLVLAQPMQAKYDIDLSRDGHAIVSVDAPAAEVPGKASLDGAELQLTVHSPDLKAANELSVEFELKQSGMRIADAYRSKLPPNSPPFKDLAAKGKIEVSGKRRFVLEAFNFSLNHGQVAFDAQGSGDLQEKTLQSIANLSVQMRDDFPEVNGQKLRGQIKIPITVTVLRGKQISLVGEMGLNGVSWKKGDLSASGINGKIPFSEKLDWDGKNIRFATLVTQNPFERVDFDRVRPLLQSSERLRIDKIGWFEKSYGPMVGFFSVDQNMIFAHQFDMDLVSGKLYGEMFINTHPQTLQYGLLARMTGLDLGEILPKKFLSRVPDGSKSLSGRAGFVLNLNRNTMDGRIDVTEIGGSQLITAINIVDPVYADEKMNKVRRLLEVGYPTSVELSFADGYMDMDLGLTVLGVSSRQNVHGVRISSMLQKATAGFMETAEKGPLK